MTISFGLLADPAPTENEAGRGQGATSKEPANEEGVVSWRFWRDHAHFRRKGIRAASDAARLVFEQQCVPWAVQREVQRAALRDAQRDALASVALATEVTPSESCSEGVAAAAALRNAALLVFEQQTVPWAVQREVQLAAQRDAQRAAPASVALATDVAHADSCVEGVAAAAALAKMALHETASRLTASGASPQAASALNRAYELLSPPMVTRRIAEAHDAIRAMNMPEDRREYITMKRRHCIADCEETGQVALLAVREALVLQICCTAGSLSAVQFEFELEQAFGRKHRPDIPFERLQLHRTRAGICRLGRDRDNFMRSAPKISNGALGDQQLTELYQAYAKCANGAPGVAVEASWRTVFDFRALSRLHVHSDYPAMIQLNPPSRVDPPPAPGCIDARAGASVA